MNNKYLSLVLKLFAVFLWSFVPVFLITVLSVQYEFLAPFTPDVRGGIYAWDFEFYFTVLFLVWGIYVWKVSKNPLEHKLFISFSAWAILTHGIVSIAIGLIKPDELAHLLRDSIFYFFFGITILLLNKQE